MARITYTTAVRAAFSATSDEALLKTFASLTHRIHAARRPAQDDLLHDLRSQRDLVETEILRRMGGAS